MNPARHLGAGAALGAGFYLASGDPASAAALGAGCFILDADHIFDFLRDQGFRKSLALLREGAVGGRRIKLRRLYLWFHSWDALLALAVYSFFFLENRPLMALLAGAAVHLGMDQIGNRGARGLTYILAYRIWKGFRREDLVADEPGGMEMEG
ncbi:MAG TPA: hypothetical protein DDZ83_13945 [Nitrospinae bacterium]|nr:hypothetical protein [Nitrospinota bacterium]